MNTENIVLTTIGLIGGFLIEGALVWLYLKSWLQKDCKAQGPDFVRRNIRGPLLLWSAISVALLLILVILDAFYFSRKGTLVYTVRKVPLLGEWGDLGVLAWPLWTGAFFGLLLGTLAGAGAAVYGIPKRNLKCRRVFRLISN